MELIKYYWLSMVEAPNFPSWEIFLFLTTALFVSCLIRLHRLEKKIDENSEVISDILREIMEER